jgi:hypothetical protein
MVATFLATAIGILKIPNRKTPTLSGYFRPRTSEAGPNIKGPNANPRTYRAVARTDTSLDIPNSWMSWPLAGLITDEPKVAMHTSEAKQAVMNTFLGVEKLRGLFFKQGEQDFSITLVLGVSHWIGGPIPVQCRHRDRFL